MWQAIQAASWANIWAAISAISTFSAVVVAALAMLRWKKQDELKVKLEFKQNIARMAYCLSRMPDKITLPEREKSKALLAELKDHFTQCTHSWLASEGLLDSYPDVKKNWDFIYKNIDFYYWGKINNDELGACCVAILHQRFVFK